MEVVLPMESFFAEYKFFCRDSGSFLTRRQIGGTGKLFFQNYVNSIFLSFKKNQESVKQYNLPKS